MPRSRAAPSPAKSSSRAEARPRPAPSSSSSQSYASSSTPSSTPAPASGGWFGSRPAATPSAPAPAPYASAPPPAMPQSSGGGMLSGLMGSVVTGAAMGTGSAMAHRAVDSFMGPRETRVVHENAEAPAAAAPAPMAPPRGADGPCGDRVRAFADCMSQYHGDMGACQPYFDAMQQCKVQFNA